MHLTRRVLLKGGLAGGALMGLGNLGFLGKLGSVSAAEAALDVGAVQLDSSIAPLVRLIEETPRNRLLEEVAARIRGGLSYRDLLAALLLAGVKNVEPRPSVGFKFHAVLVVNSAHLASLSSPAEHRWLPIFWALDYYKSAEARDVQQRGDWTMGRVNESAVPGSETCAAVFREAMENWDEAKADAAVAGLARTAGAGSVYESLWRYGARDFRSIGHKAIFVANSWRTLQCIGWRHAEPVLRSLAYALLSHEGGNPATRDAGADRPYRRNLDQVRSIREGWLGGTIDHGAAEALLGTIRSGSDSETSDHVVELLNRGVAPQSIWDALQLGAAELLMRRPGIIALHAVTTTNALQTAFRYCGDDATRRLLLLQNASFLPLFRGAMGGRGAVHDIRIDELRATEVDADPGQVVERIFATLKHEPHRAAEQALGLLGKSGRAETLIDAARVLVFLKGDDAHDYKFSSAVLEDYYHVSPRWRNPYLAANLFHLRGSQDPDNALVQRTRAALNA